MVFRQTSLPINDHLVYERPHTAHIEITGSDPKKCVGGITIDVFVFDCSSAIWDLIRKLLFVSTTEAAGKHALHQPAKVVRITSVALIHPHTN